MFWVYTKKENILQGSKFWKSKILSRVDKQISSKNIAYIDETGIDTYLFWEHGYAPKGHKLYDKISEKNING